MAHDRGQWVLLLVVVASAGLIWLLRLAVAHGGFLMLVLLVVPVSCAGGFAIGLPPPGVLSKAELMHSTDLFNLAYVDSPRLAILNRLADGAHACKIGPNTLTISSLFAVLGMGYAVLYGDAAVGLALWLYYAYVDELDGHVARRFAQTSEVGAWLDAIVDVGSHTMIAFATVCCSTGHSGEYGEGAAFTVATFAVGIGMQQLYDEALDLARGAQVPVGETIPAILGFLQSDASERDAYAALGRLGLLGHGFVRYISHPSAMLCHLFADPSAQAGLLVAHLVYALVIRRSLRQRW